MKKLILSLSLVTFFAMGVPQAKAHGTALDGILTGAGAGAIAGQIAGRNTESTIAGAVIGATVGALLGGAYAPPPRQTRRVRYAPPPRYLPPRFVRAAVVHNPAPARRHHYWYPYTTPYHFPGAPKARW